MTIRNNRKARRARRGTAIVGVLVVLLGVVGIVYATGSQTIVEVKDSRRAIDEVRVAYLAEAGIQRGMNFLNAAMRNSSMHEPLGGLTSLFEADTTLTPLANQPVLDEGAEVGSYTVRVTQVAATATTITIAIDATGYVAGPGGDAVGAWRALRSTVRFSLAPSEVFDYAYFLNNWGWFYGNTIRAYGNARSNGQFDCAGYRPTITGQPLYDAVSWNGTSAQLSGYRDDNNDGLSDGNDGGIVSSWDIANAQNVTGNGGRASNQHEFEAPVAMPNLSDLSMYETSARALNASITINGVQVTNAVYGDEAGEKQNLYLVGTTARPIVLNGPVVVRGDVIISGVVTGQGAIYSGRNVYCPTSVTYKNGPATPRPANNTQAGTEAWITASWNKDFLGLFARENVVVGNYTDGTWQSYVGRWMSDAMNGSAEDAGADGIPNTRNGRDGIYGTADDDVLEGDGVFTIDRYTEGDAALGLIPPGKNPGDPIPGSGEDIDGDGVYDGTTTLAHIPVRDAMTTANWGGNIPAGGVANYGSISTLTANRLDAMFYTNHSFCWVVLGGTKAQINGGVVSRNENIVYGTPELEFNHDSRLLGGASSKFANLLPLQVQPMEVLRWTELDFDPNHGVAAP